MTWHNLSPLEWRADEEVAVMLPGGDRALAARRPLGMLVVEGSVEQLVAGLAPRVFPEGLEKDLLAGLQCQVLVWHGRA